MSELQTLTESMVEMEEQAALERVQALLAGGTGAQDVLGALSDGMSIVGERYSSKEYYLADLVYAAEIFKQAM